MRKVTVVGSNLFAVAAQLLNDATQWWRIAELNGLSDPFSLGYSAGAYLTDDSGNAILADPGNMLILIDQPGVATSPLSLFIPAPDASYAGQGIPKQ